MARKSARSVIKNYQIHGKDIDERIKQRTKIINQIKYRTFVLKSKWGNKIRFQQSAQGRAFSLQELKNNLQYVITVNAEGDQQQVVDDTQRQTGERLKIAKESIKSKLDKFNSRKKNRK